MPQDHSFDIASKANLAEVDNSIQIALKEIQNRFDFKGSISNIKRENDKLIVDSDDEFKLKNVLQILQEKLTKRGISLKFLDYGKVEQALGGSVQQEIKIKQGIPQDQAKEINKKIKESGLKIQSQIQGDQIRVTAKKIDDLQAIIQFLKKTNFPIELQFTNYR